MKQINYLNTSVEYLLADDYFIGYCLNPSVQQIKFWDEFIKSNPEMSAIIGEAKEIILAIYKNDQSSASSEIKSKNWTAIHRKISEDTSKVKSRRSNYFVWSMAASVILIIGLFWFYNQDNSPQMVEWSTVENTSDSIINITLEDHSLVALSPQSQIKYPNSFSTKSRDLILSGHAFFDINKDTLRPFMIYANETITKVLGTSFYINAKNDVSDVEVEVISGKVAVYAQDASKNNKPNEMLVLPNQERKIPKPNNKVLLTPNQKVTYNNTKRHLTKSLVKVPQLLKHHAANKTWVFKNASVSDIFSTMSEIYGVEIKFDDRSIANCQLSTEIGTKNMFEQLDMITQALDLEYTEKEARIIVSGTGC